MIRWLADAGGTEGSARPHEAKQATSPALPKAQTATGLHKRNHARLDPARPKTAYELLLHQLQHQQHHHQQSPRKALDASALLVLPSVLAPEQAARPFVSPWHTGLGTSESSLGGRHCSQSAAQLHGTLPSAESEVARLLNMAGASSQTAQPQDDAVLNVQLTQPLCIQRRAHPLGKEGRGNTTSSGLPPPRHLQSTPTRPQQAGSQDLSVIQPQASNATERTFSSVEEPEAVRIRAALKPPRVPTAAPL